MTSDQIAKVAETMDWCGEDGTPMMNPGMSNDVATLRATLEVAYQLARLNEGMDSILNNRNPQIRVMVEPGDWPLQVQVQERR
jgi:hypothetical protein